MNTNKSAKAAQDAGSKNKYYRDHTCRFWDVFTQSWRRMALNQVPDRVLASWSEEEREIHARKLEKCGKRA